MSAPPLPTTPAPTGNGVSVISFDPQAFHEADEAELQQEETVRQNEVTPRSYASIPAYFIETTNSYLNIYIPESKYLFLFAKSFSFSTIIHND